MTYARMQELFEVPTQSKWKVVARAQFFFTK